MPSERVPTGVPGLDELIEGGFPKGSIVLIAGGPGVGKTIFGLQFLCEGAKRGKKGLFLSFEEPIEKLVEEAETLGIKLKEWSEKGVIEVDHFTLERISDLLDRLPGRIRDLGVERLVIDSLSSLLVNAMELQTFYRFGVVELGASGLSIPPIPKEMVERRVMKGIIGILRETKATTLLTYELEGGEIDKAMPAFQCDGVISLTLDEVMNVRKLRIRKLRGTKHPLGARSVEITTGGLRLLE